MNKLFTVFLLNLSYLLQAQEIKTHLSSKKVNNLPLTHNHLRISSLPFFDDFSNLNITSLNWTDKNIFVNDEYPINQISKGVATFDGIDSNGYAYDISISTSWGVADFLTSRNIDLSSSDSLFMLFFYQPQGIGDNPQEEDSLVLEFLDDSLRWNRVWSVKGSSYYPFKKKVILVNQEKYLHSNFKFRFFNYATLSGNFDHWNLDYVKLDNFNRSSDTVLSDDVAFVGRHSSLLKRYTQMPWKHFLNNQAIELKDSIDIPIRNNNASINVDYKYFVFDQNDNLLSNFPISGWRNYSIFNFDSIGNFSHSPAVFVDDNIFNSSQIDSAFFKIRHIIRTGSDDYKFNDTIDFVQGFSSYFSYDDGTAESAYGINVSGAMGAMKFKLNRPDTLRAVQIYFPQMLDSVSNLSFYLTVWKDDGGIPGDIIYSKLENPRHSRKFNFQTIVIDSLFQLSGTFYVGWVQNTDDLLNIGLDLNNVSNEYMFYNYNGVWLNSQYQGAWMIRPIVSEKKLLLKNNTIDPFEITLWPNPSKEYVFINCEKKIKNIKIFDISFKDVTDHASFDFNSRINISSLTSGVYFFSFYFEEKIISKKIIIND